MNLKSVSPMLKEYLKGEKQKMETTQKLESIIRDRRTKIQRKHLPKTNSSASDLEKTKIKGKMKLYKQTKPKKKKINKQILLYNCDKWRV